MSIFVQLMISFRYNSDLGGLFNPTFQYSDFLDPRFQSMYRAAVGHHQHALYSHFPSYASQLYPMIPNAQLSSKHNVNADYGISNPLWKMDITDRMYSISF